MELSQNVEELQATQRQLTRLNRLKTLRRVLKVFLIGFFWGKDIDKRLKELTLRKNSILADINDYCISTLKAISKEIKDIENSGTYLVHDRKEQCETSLDSYDNDLSYLDKNGVLGQEFISTQRKEEQQREVLP